MESVFQSWRSRGFHSPSDCVSTCAGWSADSGSWHNRYLLYDKAKNKVLSGEQLHFYFRECLDKIVLVIGPMHVSSYGELDGQR